MATTVDTLLVRIESDMSDIRRDLKSLERQTSQSTNKMQGAFSKLGKFIGPAIGVAVAVAVTRAGTSLVKFASDIEEMTSMSEAVFGQFVGKVRADLEEFGEAVGRSKFDLEEMAASVQDTFVPLGFARGEAADLSVQLTKLAVDVGSFKNQLAPDVMNAFQSALVGNHEAVRRFGIIITEAELKQELFRMGITKNINQVTAQEKVQARYNLILAGTTDAQGDALKTAGSFANLSNALNAELGMLAAGIGDSLLPAAKDLVITFTDATKATREFLRVVGIIETAPMQRLQEIIESNAKDQERLNALRAQDSPLARNLRKDIAARNEERQSIINQLHAQEMLIAGRARATNQQPESTENDDKATIAADKLAKAQQKLRDSTALMSAEMGGANKVVLAQMKFAQGLGVTIKDLDIQTKQLIATNVITAQSQDALNKKIQEAKDDTKELKGELIPFKEELSDVDIALIDLSKSVGQAQLSQMDFKGETADVLSFLQQYPEATAKQVEAFQKLNEAHSQVSNVINNQVSPAMQSAISYVRSMMTEEEALRMLQLGLIEAFLLGEISLEQYEKAMASVEAKMEKLGESSEAVKQMIQTVNSAIANASTQISQNFADMLVDGKFSLDGLKDVFSSMVKQIIAKAFELMVVNRIMNSIFKGSSSFVPLPTFQSGGSVSTAMSGGAVIPPMRKFAKGGNAPILVGEGGPELFVPHTGGSIKNKMDTKNMLSGGGTININQNINVSTGVADTVRAEMATFMPVIREDTLRAVQEARRRGGSFARAFGG